MELKDKVTAVKGVGPKMEEKLGRLGIHTVEDLISYFPRKYQDWTNITPMDALDTEDEHVVYGRIVDVREVRPRPRLSIITVVLTDGRGAVNLTYFNQPWKRQAFDRGQGILAYGKVEYVYGKYQMSNAETISARPEEIQSLKKLVPVYPLTEGIRLQQMQKMIAYALQHMDTIEENLPSQVRMKYHLMERKEAVYAMHFPRSWEEQKRARYRLAFEELFFMQAGIWLLRKKREQGHTGIKCSPDGKLMLSVMKNIPFELTDDQKQVLVDIESDMEGLVPMQRLIQGDVGSGKTVIAALALAKIVENGYQGALMAPTEILAAQHYKTLSELYDGTGIRTELLTGQTRASDKKEILSRLASGKIDILVGTHSLIEDPVEFAHLGMVVTDEQHRFGVKQRERLETKGDNPHILVMTATPIPRTMALSVYGDLDVSSIRHLPPGRQPVGTYAVGRNMLARIYRFMKKEMNMGHQVYVVCPLVEESEKADLAAAVSVYEELRTKQFPEFCLGLVHGQMKAREKDEVMEAFVQGKIQMLVATSVIEVGVNVPNATIMFIYGADRFGLSQLHQLRGRVGRGKAKSYCILYSDNTSEAAEFRLSLMTKIQDGFTLAEKDLLLRGSGEFFGTRQHGMDDLKVANVIRDLPILEEARKAAREEISHGLDVKEELARRFHGEFFSRIYH